jgi:pilus assembly protein CpaE
MLGFLRHHFDRVVVDGVNGFDEISLAALDSSDGILLLLTQEVPAVRTTDRCLEIFRRLGYVDSRVHLVINRYQKSSAITKDVVAQSTGVPVAATVANDFAAMSRAINSGGLLRDVAPRSRAARDITRLTTLVRGDAGAQRSRKGIFNFFARGVLAHGAQ